MNTTANPTCHIFAKLIEDMKEMSSWEIVDVVEPHDVRGDRQDCSMFGHKFVDQSGPGMSGDDYAGHEYIPIEGMYLKIWYCC